MTPALASRTKPVRVATHASHARATASSTCLLPSSGIPLSGQFVVQTLLVLGAAKLIATVSSYASGGAGGIFAPSLFLGAMLGGAFGSLDARLFDHGHVEVGSFALVGMGAVFAGTIRAPITSVLIIIEMTGGYGLTLPLMISNMMAYGLARRLRPTPIYDALLEQDGIRLAERKAAANAFDRVSIERVDLAPAQVVFAAGDRVLDIMSAIERALRQEVFPVVDADRRVVGLLMLEDLADLASEHDLGGLVRAADLMRPPVALRRTDSARRALELMSSIVVRELPVVGDDETLLGLVDEAAIAHAYIRAHAKASELSTSGTLTIVE